MNYTISIFNQKGGVGKTTTAINLATALGMMGKKILLVDFDPQANASSGLGIMLDQDQPSIYEAMLGQEDINSLIRESSSKNVDLIPSHPDLSGLEVELVSFDRRNHVLKDSLDKIEGSYDLVFLDCPPSLGLLSLNALTASDSMIIPIQCEYYALEGLSQVLATMNLVKKSLNPSLTIEGVVLTMFDSRNKLSIEIVNEVKDYFRDKVYNTLIPRNIRLAEAPSHGISGIDYAPNSKGAQAYQALAKELLLDFEKKRSLENESKEEREIETDINSEDDNDNLD